MTGGPRAHPFERSYAGHCHCGRLRAVLASDCAPHHFIPWQVHAGLEALHGVLALADPRGQLSLELPSGTRAYRSHHDGVDHHLCTRCGVYIAASWCDGGRRYGIVNLRTLDLRSQFQHAPLQLDLIGQSSQLAKARRRASWTPTRMTRVVSAPR